MMFWAILFLIVTYCNAMPDLSVAPSPPAGTMPSGVFDAVPAIPTPDAQATPPAMPSPDAQTPAPAPAPDAQVAPAAPAPDATQPAAAPAGDVQATQLAWPDTADLAEDKVGMAQAANPEIINLFKDAEGILEKMAQTVDQMVKTREELYKKYFAIVTTFDDFLQNTSIAQGVVQETLTSSDKK